MTTIENNFLLQTSKYQETSDSHSQSLNFGLDNIGLDKLDLNNPDMLRPILDRINTMHAHHFNPVRFRFIESMAEKALQHRRSVADIIEKKALQALSGYVKEYVKEYASFQKRTAFQDIQKNKNQGRLAKLTQEILQSSDTEGVVSKPTLEDELRQQEKDVMRSVTGTVTDKSTDNISEVSIND